MPFWHVIGWSRTAAGAETDIAAQMAIEDILTTNGTDLQLDEDCDLVGSWTSGAVLTRAKMANPRNRRNGTPYFWNFALAATIPSIPQVQDFSKKPIRLPSMNEAIQLQITQSAAGTAQAVWWLRFGPRREIPAGERLFTRFSVVIAAGSESTWTAPAALTFTDPIAGGAWAICGAYLVAAGAQAFRLHFRKGPRWHGRAMRPGGLVQETLGLFPCQLNSYPLGVWGYFSNFEMPMVSVFGDAAGGTYVGALDMVYMGEDDNLVPLT